MARISGATIAVLALAVLATVPLGCEPTDPGNRPDAVIGVSVLTKSNPFFNELADAIVEEAATHNYKVIVADGNEDPVTQDQQVEDFITDQRIEAEFATVIFQCLQAIKSPVDK